MLSVRNLEQHYNLGENTIQVLKNVSFEVTQGEFVGIIGKSGSGKSTLLRQIGLIETPSAGKIFFDEEDTSDWSEQHRSMMRLAKLGYIFQDYDLLPDLTAVENTMLPLIAMGISKEQAINKASELLNFVGLSEVANLTPSSLSGGQQQRVAIARAVVNEPSLIIADEPTSNLDSTASTSVRKLLERLNVELCKTVIIVSHDEDDIAITRKVFNLHDGVLSLT